MNRFTALLCLGMVWSVTARTQSSRPAFQPRKWLLSFYFGGNKLLNPKGTPTDSPAGYYLHSVREGGSAFTLSAQYGLIKNGGVHLRVGQFNYSAFGETVFFERLSNYGVVERFRFESQFPDYYTSNRSGTYGAASVQRTYEAGAYYYFWLRKWFVGPVLGAGLISTQPFEQEVFLKQKNTNYTQELFYQPKTGWGFMGSGYLSVGYRFTRRPRSVRVSFNYGLIYATPSINYLISTKDVFGITTESTYQQRSSVWMDDVRFGIHYDF